MTRQEDDPCSCVLNGLERDNMGSFKARENEIAES